MKKMKKKKRKKKVSLYAFCTFWNRKAGLPSMSSHKGDYYIKNEYEYSFLICRIDMLSKTKFINDI